MFVAAWPDEPTRARLSSLPLEPVGGLVLVGQDQWHVTLRFLGEVDVSCVPVLSDALATAAGELPRSIHCDLGPATEWLGGGPVLEIPVSGLDAAADAVRSAVRRTLPDTSPADPPFIGHLTLARSKRGRMDATMRAALAGVPFASSFEVDHLDLVASERSAGGPRYTTLSRMSLRDA